MGQKVIFPGFFFPFQRRTNFAVGRLILTEDNGADNEDEGAAAVGAVGGGGGSSGNGAAANGLPPAAASVNWHFVDLTAADARKRSSANGGGSGEKYGQNDTECHSRSYFCDPFPLGMGTGF